MRNLDFSDTLANWRPLTRPRAADLRDTRQQLHWAAQLVSALGTTLCEPKADDSHTNLEWLEDELGLAGRVIPGPEPLRALLRFPDVSLVLLREGDEGREHLAELTLAGKGVDEALAWLSARVGELLGRAIELARPDHAMPEHRVDPRGEAAVFGAYVDHALVELTRWYQNGDRALRELAAQEPRAGEVRCWPHDFDIATRIVVERTAEGEVRRSLGVGMTPGDGSYADAYWYVTPWPYPKQPELAPLAGGGIWHREDWVGAVLTATALRQPQAERFVEFLRSALVACMDLVEA